MISRLPFHRSKDVGEVIHIKVKKCAGYFNPECKRFAVDPHVTTFTDLQKILVGAFNLSNPFHISYLCRDDVGESVYLALLTEWDLDAAFLSSSNPYLRLKIDENPFQEQLFKNTVSSPDADYSQNFSQSSVKIAASALEVPRSWMLSVGKAFSKITSGIGFNFLIEQNEETSFFPSKPPLGDYEFHTFLDKHGKLTQPEDLRLRIYHGGVEPSLRKVVWRLLLNIFPQNFTGKERIDYMKKKTKEYHKLCAEWRSSNKSFVHELSKTIWKDVLRTDRTHPYFSGSDNPHMTALHNLLLTYALTHKSTRYCQGMSDIASPILMVMDNEPQAYVCFCGAMTRLESNFSNTEEVMTKKFEHLGLLLQSYDPEYFQFLKTLGAENMFFCYRWLLLEMKREFSVDDAFTVLEVMWSSLPPQWPEKDLNLGKIDIEKEKGSEVGCRVKKNDSLPHLSLTTKKLTSSLHAAQSFPNLEIPANVSSKPNKSSRIQYSTVSYHCKNMYPPQTTLWALGGDVINREPHSHASNVGYDHVYEAVNVDEESSLDLNIELPPPEELGCGNPFLLFVCLSVLMDQKEELLSSRREYDDLVMHFDRLVRKHNPSKIISKAMEYFATYLRSQSLASTGAKIEA